MGVVNRRWVWVESMGVVVRRYIDFLILLIPTPLVFDLFGSSIPTFLFIFNPRRACYCSCPVCVCVFMCVCLFAVFCHHAKYRYVRVHRKTEKTFIIVIFAKNASFRSYGVICLPRMPLTTPEPQNTDNNGIHTTWA